MPIIFKMLGDVPEGTPAAAAPVCALVAVAVIVGIALKAKGSLRLWAPVIGIVAACGVAGYFGIYDTARIADAAWIGLPAGAWPGLDLEFGPVFWSLLPAFVFVTLVGALETIGDSVGIQHVSWRKPRAADFRAVQGAVTADGVGNLLSGLAGTVPNTTYSTSIAVTELTGVGARSVGMAAGAIFIVLAFCPKGLAVVLAIPNPVARRLRHRSARHAVRARDDDRRPGRRRLSQGPDRGRVLLGRRRFPERCDLSRNLCGFRRRHHAERDDGRRPGRPPAHPVRRNRQTPA